VQGGVEGDVCIVHRERPARDHAGAFAIARKVPGEQGAARKAPAYAAVRRQVLRRGGPPVRGQVGGRCHHGIALRRADGYRHHVLRQIVGKAHAGIEAALDDVGHGRVGADVHADVRVGLLKARHQRRQHEVRNGARRIQAQRAEGHLAVAVEPVHRIRYLGQGRLQVREQLLARIAGRHAARGALEQHHAQLLLQPAQVLAQQRGCHAPLQRRAAKAAMPGHGGEDFEVGQRNAVHCVAMVHCL